MDIDTKVGKSDSPYNKPTCISSLLSIASQISLDRREHFVDGVLTSKRKDVRSPLNG